MKKKLLCAALCAAMTGTMAAPAAVQAADGKLVYWSMWDEAEPQGQVIKEAVAKFTEETGVEVDVEFKGRTGQREGLQPALDAGQQIDVFDEDVDRVNTSWGKYLLDLEEYVKDGYEEEHATPVLFQIARDVAGGTLKSIPYQPSLFCFMYNKDLFDQAGIEEVPADWDSFLEACQKLTDAGITPLTCDDAYIDCMIAYHLGRLGGEAKVKEIVENGQWDDPIVLQMAEDYEELASKGYFSPNLSTNVWPAGQNTEFATGTVAMYLNGTWLPNEVKAVAGDSFRWGSFAYPAVEGGVDGTEANNIANQVFAINKDSSMPAEAFQLIEYLTTGEVDQNFVDQALCIPADQANGEAWPEALTEAKAVLDNTTTRYGWAVSIESNNDITPVIKENFTKLCSGSLDAQGFVDAMVEASK
ncbi:MAG: ABC transporter substrate-binding protein [Eubacteriales bacterium]|nr:ABC transporter substrate-binding protein [Eubacteriales bacterium]